MCVPAFRWPAYRMAGAGIGSARSPMCWAYDLVARSAFIARPSEDVACHLEQGRIVVEGRCGAAAELVHRVARQCERLGGHVEAQHVALCGRVRRRGNAPVWQESLELGVEPVRRQWDVPGGLRLEGSVQNADGSPRAGAVVDVAPPGEPWSARASWCACSSPRRPARRSPERSSMRPCQAEVKRRLELEPNGPARPDCQLTQSEAFGKVCRERRLASGPG